MPRAFVSLSRHPHMAEPNHGRSADYQLAGGRTVSGERLSRLMAQEGSATTAVASLLAKGEKPPRWLLEMAAAEITGAAPGLPEWMQ